MERTLVSSTSRYSRAGVRSSTITSSERSVLLTDRRGTFTRTTAAPFRATCGVARAHSALTAPDGATITGTVTEKNIQVPSPGVPYTLVITAGTQQFAGATGTCRLDNHLHQIHFGLQDDFGAFTCNITV